MPSAEEKVCQRQMRKKKNVVEIDRLKLVLCRQGEKEGACRPCSAVGVLNESWPCRGTGAEEAASPGSGVRRGSTAGSARCSAWNGPAPLCSRQPAASLRGIRARQGWSSS